MSRRTVISVVSLILSIRCCAVEVGACTSQLPFSLDINASDRIASVGEKLTYDSQWYGSASSTVRIRINETDLAEGAGVGEWIWEPHRPGTYTITATTYQNGAIVGDVLTADFVVVGRDLVNASVIFPDGMPLYDGTERTPRVEIVYQGETLVEGQDYTLKYENNISGVGKVIITGMGRFHDEVEQTFNIQPAGICSLDICSGTRIAHLPEKITYDENWFSSAGAGYVRIMENGARILQENGCGEYSWSPIESGLCTLLHRTYIDGYLQDQVYTATFLVGGGSLTQSGIAVTLSPTSFAYDGMPKKPAVIVTHEGARLTEGLDYLVSYRDNVEIGTGYVVVSGMGKYSDVVEKTFTITESPGVCQVTAQQRYPWNGLVDVSFKIVGQQYTVTLAAKDMVGGTNLPMRTVYKQDGIAVNMAGESLVSGTYNWVWDAAADLPDGFECEQVTVTIEFNDEFVYSVRFNANGGTGTMEDETFTHGTAKVLTPNSFTRAGYQFQGWAMSSAGAKMYDDEQSVSNLTETIGAVVNLYAVWMDIRDKVQLWEGGPYWATTNIGANEPWDSGYYFWWGDTIGYKREGNAWVASDGSSLNFGFRTENTPTYGKSNATLKTEGWLTEEEILAPEHDAAQKHWGGEWRLPTHQEMNYLVSLCDWIWTTTNNVKGYVIRGRGEYSSASIFLPITGFGEGTSLSYGANGYYWLSTPTFVGSYYNMPYYASYLGFNPPGANPFSLYGDYFTVTSGDRYDGRPLRPVKGFSE